MNETIRDVLSTALAPFLEQQRQRAALELPGDSYWFHRPQRDFPPKAISDPADYDGGAHLSLAITQTSLSAGAQRKLLQHWCALLPTLTAVKVLWFQSKVTQAMFEAACAMPGLQGLYIKWSAISTLAPLQDLAALSHLHIGSAPSATGLDVLGRLPALLDLEIHNVREAADLRFLAGLTRLRSLQIAGDSNSIKPLKLPTLAPLATLRGLQKLGLITVRVEDGSLAPLAELPELRWLALCNAFPMEEVARLAGRRPGIECERFAPSSGPVAALACKQCRQHSLHMLTGKGKPWLCERCDAERLAKHIAEFEAVRAAAARVD